MGWDGIGRKAKREGERERGSYEGGKEKIKDCGTTRLGEDEVAGNDQGNLS